MRVAGIDCGTNSVRLLIADVQPDGALVDYVREMRIVRLGQGVDRTGRLSAEALERTRIALVEYAKLIVEYRVDAARMIATSATRDAVNRDDFVVMVRSILDVEPEVIDGRLEAVMTFAGAVASLPNTRHPLRVADIGGGSTELVLSDVAAPIGDVDAISMDVGSVRITERHLRADPPTPAEVDAARDDIVAAIDQARATVAIERAASFVGVAGTVTTMAAIALGMSSYQPDLIHHSYLTADQIHELTGRLLAMTHHERAALPAMHPGRADVIAGGALILSELVRATGIDGVIASEHDILDAVAASAIRTG